MRVPCALRHLPDALAGRGGDLAPVEREGDAVVHGVSYAAHSSAARRRRRSSPPPQQPGGSPASTAAPRTAPPRRQAPAGRHASRADIVAQVEVAERAADRDLRRVERRGEVRHPARLDRVERARDLGPLPLDPGREATLLRARPALVDHQHRRLRHPVGRSPRASASPTAAACPGRACRRRDRRGSGRSPGCRRAPARPRARASAPCRADCARPGVPGATGAPPDGTSST